MKQRESLEIRKEMVEMHETYLDRLKTTMDTKQFVEATWICYAIYEQRINRIIEKILPKCPVVAPRTSNNSASISTRINCLKKLISKSYGGLAQFDFSLLEDISTWCDDRNDLVHDLVNLDKYTGSAGGCAGGLAQRVQPNVPEVISITIPFKDELVSDVIAGADA